MNARIKDIDKGYKALLERLKKASVGIKLTVGIHEAEGGQAAEGAKDSSLIEVAAYNEFGGPGNNPPRRSFIADWADENADQHRVMINRSARAVVAGKLPDMRTALDRLGLRFVGEVQQRIRSGIGPPNAPSTVKAKGSSTPLIDSGQLWSSITHHVEDGASSGEESGGGGAGGATERAARSYLTGPRGGIYYVNSAGDKVYPGSKRRIK